MDLEVENLGSVPCILVEPMGKLINNEFVSTGMAIILQGHCLTTKKRSTPPPTHEINVARISQRGSMNLFDYELCLLVE